MNDMPSGAHFFLGGIQTPVLMRSIAENDVVSAAIAWQIRWINQGRHEATSRDSAVYFKHYPLGQW